MHDIDSFGLFPRLSSRTIDAHSSMAVTHTVYRLSEPPPDRVFSLAIHSLSHRGRLWNVGLIGSYSEAGVK